MSAQARGSLCTIAAAQIDDENRQWIEVIPVADKVRNGSFYFTITRDDLETLAESIRANPGKIPIDYDHAAFDGGSSRAAGWYTGQARVVDHPELDAVLEAEVEWTPRAAQEIRDGEYRFTSAEWGFAEKDSKSGLMTKATRVKASTLTNRPFFNELSALASDDGQVLWDADQGVNQLQSDLAEALNPGASNYDAIRYWVCDVDPVGQRVLVCSAGPGDEAWIVPYQRDQAGNIAIPPSSDWVPVEQAWVADTDGDDVPTYARRAHEARALVVTAAQWTSSYVNDLPDSAFLYVESGGEKDSSGKTTPRSLRHFPYKDSNGNVDMPHLRNAASRIPQSDLPADVKERLAKKCEQLMKDNGGESAASTKEDHVSEELKALAVDLGLPEDATSEQIAEAVKTAKATADRVPELEQELETAKAAATAGGDRTVVVDKEKYAQLERNAELGVTAHRKQLEQEADQLVTAAVEDGRIAPASKDDWRTAILPDEATELVTAETEALASLAPGRIPVADRVVTGGDQLVTGQLDTVRAHLGLKTKATA